MIKRYIALSLACVALMALPAAMPRVTRAAVGQISPMELQLLGQSQLLAGSKASLRIVARNHETGEPLACSIAVGLRGEDGVPLVLFRGQANRSGTVDAQFAVPDLPAGQYTLSVSATSALGTERAERSITLVESARILLTTDKPVYQPGQVIHIRALALRVPDLRPVAGEKVTLEVMDSKGNKVFKRITPASKFGIVHADFQLADEINMGSYTVRAVLPQGTAQKQVTVERYVLPKFKVTVKADRKFYLPGQTLTGKLSADYFFGKPVAGGDVSLAVSTFDVGWSEIARLKGKTDRDGAFAFEVELPDHFVGQPLEQGKALVKIEAEVTDRAEHTEKATTSVPVAKDPLVITIVPESAQLKPGLSQVVYIMVTYPDGTPARAKVREYRVAGSRAGYVALGETDALGIIQTRVSPDVSAKVRVIAEDDKGNRAEKEQALSTEAGEDAILLRLDKAIAKVGDSVKFTVLCTRPTGTIYLDMVKDGQTILTRSLGPKEERVGSIPLTAEMAGTVEIHAYKILPNENIIRDARRLLVTRADDLRIDIKPDKATYRPGEEALLRFSVTDAQKHPVLAALGIVVVDEAVFALQEMQPGLEKVYFLLEKELMEPRYEIHRLSPTSLVRGELPVEPTEGLKQEAAHVLFALAPVQDRFTMRVNTYRERAEKLRQEWLERMVKDAEKINEALRKYAERYGRDLDPKRGVRHLVSEGLLDAKHLLDPRGSAYRVTIQGRWCSLESAGPDGKWNTEDDLREVGGVRFKRAGARDLFAEDVAALGAIPRFGPAGPAALPPVAVAATPAMAAKGVGGYGEGLSEAPIVRVREYFPETMFFEPALITDEKGRAQITLPLADSITTWRLSAMASSLRGQLGSETEPLRVFQDFFVDIDLPVSFTQNDEASVPIAVYNYLREPQKVRLVVEKEPWFELLGDAEQTVELKPNEVTAVHLSLRMKEIGRHRLTVRAHGTRLSDAIRREVTIMPDGEEVRENWNDRLDKTVERTVTVPKDAIPGAGTILVKIYPGLFSQAVEGLDSLLRMPFGCFEQTSSVTYPNVLVLDYLKRTKKANAELQMKAEGFVNVGYQRLVSYEVQGGGFSWFGDAPAHKILTAYGLMEFWDMSRVHEVDPALIERTQRWLAGLQQADGTWQPDEGGIAEGIINRQTGVLRVTAYIAWALAETGYKGPEVARALDYVRGKWAAEKDPYALAVVANAFMSADPASDEGQRVASALAALAVEEEKTAYWKSDAPTFTGASKDQGDLETTALAAYALLKSDRHAALVGKALNYLIRSKDSFGTWNTTQATVWALKALLLSLEKAAGEIEGEVLISINGAKAASFTITKDDWDVLRQADLREWVRPGENRVEISFAGRGSALYQIVNQYYLPWKKVEKKAEPLSIAVGYDKTALAANDTVTASVSVRNNTPLAADMVIIDLGLPPGFDVMTEDFQAMVDKKVFQKFTLAARQIIVYVERIEPGRTLEFTYRLRAKFPIRAKTRASRVYEYYNPDNSGRSAPQALVVGPR